MAVFLPGGSELEICLAREAVDRGAWAMDATSAKSLMQRSIRPMYALGVHTYMLAYLATAGEDTGLKTYRLNG